MTQRADHDARRPHAHRRRARRLGLAARSRRDSPTNSRNHNPSSGGQAQNGNPNTTCSIIPGRTGEREQAGTANRSKGEHDARPLRLRRRKNPCKPWVLP